MMRRLVSVLTGVLLATLVPSVVYAQASIAGVVKDASGAVLPGVTVEAASPALIEKVRSVVTDDSGQYRIVDLRPGTYSVTFTLTGFSVVKREGIELTGSFNATINADLKVGGLEETITVTGESPIVDTQSIRRQTTLDHEILTTAPTARSWAAILVRLALTSSWSAYAAATPSRCATPVWCTIPITRSRARSSTTATRTIRSSCFRTARMHRRRQFSRS